MRRRRGYLSALEANRIFFGHSRGGERTNLTVHLLSNAPNVERFAPVWISCLYFLLIRENEKKCDTVSPRDAADAT